MSGNVVGENVVGENMAGGNGRSERVESPSGGGSSTDVLIVGAGPSGLTLALVLARRGVPFRIIESEVGPRPGSRGKGVQPRTLEAFADLGIVDRILAQGRMAMPMDMISADGGVRRGGDVPAALADRPDIPYPASVITPEWRVEDALREHLARYGRHVEFGTRLVDLQQTAEGVLAQVTADGATHVVSARWLIGADGGHSAARKLAGIAFEGETREDVRLVIADLPLTGIGRERWRTWRHPRGIVSLCPLPSTDLFQCTATLAPGEEPRLETEHLQEVLEQRSGRTDIRLGEPVWTSVWRANVRLAAHYRAGRVLLMGDAAHIHSPAGGQGMNTGIQDACNLGCKLAAVLADGAPEPLIDTYEAERRPVAQHVLAFTDARLAETQRTREFSVKRDESTIQLDVGCRGSRLSVDDRDEASDLRAGDRAPDATGLIAVDGPHRLFDLIGGGIFTLLEFGGAPWQREQVDGIRVLRVVDEPRGEGEIADGDGTLAAAYAPTDRTRVLIRPDGCIGVLSDAGDLGVIRDCLAAVGIQGRSAESSEPAVAREQGREVSVDCSNA